MIARLLGLLICCLPLLAWADEARLGRLFLTPAERASLNVVRQNSKPPEKIIKAGEVEEEEVPVENQVVMPERPPVVTVRGFVKRSDGKGTVWVNDQPVQEKTDIKGIAIGRLQGNTSDVQIKLPSTGQTVKLKAGQSYDPASGKVGSLREIVPSAEPAVIPANGRQDKMPAATKAEPPLSNQQDNSKLELKPSVAPTPATK